MLPTARQDSSRESEVLVLAPTGRDASLIGSVLAHAAVDVRICQRLEDLLAGIAGSAGIAVIAEEALTPLTVAELERAIRHQPEWSDFPLIILTSPRMAARARLDVLKRDGNVSLMERPLRMENFVSGVHSALRARRRQYEIRAHLEAQKRATEHQRVLLAELSHRVKNTLASVQSIVTRSLQPGRPMEECRTILSDRIVALGAAHSLLAVGRWRGASLQEVIEQAIEPFRAPHGSGLELAGTDVQLNPTSALTLAMALHELVTNAAKYGAFSVPDGQLTVAWCLDDSNGELQLTWEERNGPPVKAPQSGGFGTRFIERSVTFELDGSVELDFRSTGLVCTIGIPERSWAGGESRYLAVETVSEISGTVDSAP